MLPLSRERCNHDSPTAGSLGCGSDPYREVAAVTWKQGCPVTNEIDVAIDPAVGFSFPKDDDMNLARNIPFSAKPMVGLAPGHDVEFFDCETLYFNAAGRILLRLRGDNAPVAYVVAAGDTLHGLWACAVFEYGGVTSTIVADGSVIGWRYSTAP